MFRLKDLYQKKVIPEMKKIFGYKNDFLVPKLEKVTLNIGLNVQAVKKDPRLTDFLKEILIKITGQKPIETKAKKSISGFKVRKGETVGLKVTLRRGKMYDFIDKLIHVVLARTRDFSGLSRRLLDQQGNLSFGLKEQQVFPEIQAEGLEKIFGLQITITTIAKTKEESLKLLELLGFPFKEK